MRRVERQVRRAPEWGWYALTETLEVIEPGWRWTTKEVAIDVATEWNQMPEAERLAHQAMEHEV